MQLLRHIYFWASEGCPDAMPAGIIAVDLGLNEANHNDQDIGEFVLAATSWGFFDDSCWQIGCTMEDADLVRKLDGPGYLTSDQIVTDWQWEQIKKTPGLRFAEHSFAEAEAEMAAWEEE